MLTALEEKVIRSLQRDLPVTARPFQEVAEELGLSEEELTTIIRRLMEQGYIRRFGATIRHRLSGFQANAMAAWSVPADRLAEVGALMAACREVTHCYERQGTDIWPYNLYTMIHGKTQEECEAIAQRLAAAAGIQDYVLLFSDAELKKTTMRYFQE
ncbi:MAG: siroheme decarboxylase subunit beta [Desulfobacca sp.]|uniref:siroheme decarboxylase subunit beta n=1 Tax=Desulfobacca sp. TaxID=2067990 RepID=UPI00404A0CDC